MKPICLWEKRLGCHLIFIALKRDEYFVYIINKK